MIQVKTQDLPEYLRTASPDAKLWIYNAYDVMLPQEIFVEVKSRMNSGQLATYEFEKALQGPAFSMMQNGVKVDYLLLQRELNRAIAERKDLESYVRSLACAAWNDGVNVGSPAQMQNLFYLSPMGFQCAKQYTGSGGKRHISCDRKALERVYAVNYNTRPLINAIWSLKDVTKRIEFLERGVEKDGRVHCSFNVAATETGRWSSSKNPWGRGANFQNPGESTRGIYLADEGWIFAYPDLSQAESYAVAYHSGDPNYIRAVNSGDLHTAVAQLIWPDLTWKGNSKADRDLAEEPFYRHFSRRDMSKRAGHASNYLITKWTLAKQLLCSDEQAEEIMDKYFRAFPGIKLWHDEVQREIQRTGKLTTALGRERMFFGRLDSNETLKKAVAFLPQSLISDILKIGTLYAWREFELNKHWIKLCGDLHDGVLMQIKEIHLDKVVPRLKELMTISVKMPHGVMTVPMDFTIGYRWQKKEMKEWKRGILSELKRPTETSNLLDLPASEV